MRSKSDKECHLDKNCPFRRRFFVQVIILSIERVELFLESKIGKDPKAIPLLKAGGRANG